MSETLDTADAFFAGAQLATSLAVLPDGNKVRIREMTAAERAEFPKLQKADPAQVAAWLTLSCCLDGKGAALFSADTLAQLQAASPRLTEAISIAVMRLSGLLDDPGKNV